MKNALLRIWVLLLTPFIYLLILGTFVLVKIVKVVLSVRSK
jgi:hypothetical protein